MKLEKFEKFCELISKGLTKYDFIVILVTYLLCALAKDLNLTTLFNVSGSIFLAFVVWYICSCICLIIMACIKKHNLNKTNIEKLIDEESERESKFDDKALEDSYDLIKKAVDEFESSLLDDSESKKGE